MVGVVIVKAVMVAVGIITDQSNIIVELRPNGNPNRHDESAEQECQVTITRAMQSKSTE